MSLVSIQEIVTTLAETIICMALIAIIIIISDAAMAKSVIPTGATVLLAGMLKIMHQVLATDQVTTITVNATQILAGTDQRTTLAKM